MIYVASMQEGRFVKIGYCSGSSESRIKALQTGNPYQIDLLFEVEGSLMQELALHASLKVAMARVRLPNPANEWYVGKHPFMVKFLSELRIGPNFAMAHSEKYNPAIKQDGRPRPKRISERGGGTFDPARGRAEVRKRQKARVSLEDTIVSERK